MRYDSLAEQVKERSLGRQSQASCNCSGLCPLLAVTTTFVNGLGLGIATLAVLMPVERAGVGNPPLASARRNPHTRSTC